MGHGNSRGRRARIGDGFAQISESRQHLRDTAKLLVRTLSRLDRRILARYLATHQIRKLSIGSGDNIEGDWLNTNYLAGLRQRGVMHLDARDPFPLPDDSFDYVNSEHMIEHVDHRYGISMISECYRVLKPGGRIRITTPDLAFLVELLKPNRTDLQNRYIAWAHESLPDEPEASPTAVFNNFVRNWGHRFIYDRETLEGDMRRAGFVDCIWLPLNESPDPNLRGLEHPERMPDGFLALESMTCEAVKPSRH